MHIIFHTVDFNGHFSKRIHQVSYSVWYKTTLSLATDRRKIVTGEQHLHVPPPPPSPTKSHFFYKCSGLPSHR